MKILEPKVFRIAETKFVGGIYDWLEHLGVPKWTSTGYTSDAELLIEACGRRCYKAFGTELNPNITKVREGNQEYLENIIKQKHGAVMEHAYVTFAIEDVTRVFTHEVVRHRLCNFSQESLRFVRPTSLNAYFPNVFKDIKDEYVRNQVLGIFETTFIHLEDVQKTLVELLRMDEMKDFNMKKLLQSSMRRMMPIGLCTGIIVTSNHRNWRHLIELRTAPSAEEEIRVVFLDIAKSMQECDPNLYQDMLIHDDGTCTFKGGRV